MSELSLADKTEKEKRRDKKKMVLQYGNVKLVSIPLGSTIVEKTSEKRAAKHSAEHQQASITLTSSEANTPSLRFTQAAMDSAGQQHEVSKRLSMLLSPSALSSLSQSHSHGPTASTINMSLDARLASLSSMDSASFKDDAYFLYHNQLSTSSTYYLICFSFGFCNCFVWVGPLLLFYCCCCCCFRLTR
jgi:hypothetical protein